ncbi:MAG: 5'-nucleotidase [Cryomorphaceae bacterium]
MSVNFDGALVIAISSRALFNLEEGHQIYLNKGVDAYYQHQLEHENEILKKGVAFSLAEKLLALNDLSETTTQVEVVLISRNSADTGLRIFNSIAHHKLNIIRAAFTGGEAPWGYAKSFNADLFLSADPADVKAALDANLAAATILPSQVTQSADKSDELRIAFDGDAVLFSDEAEKIYQQEGLEKFTLSEQQSANNPLPGGPFKSFLASLHHIQSAFKANHSPIRTALFTARSAPAHERVIRTLRAWNIRIDEAAFLGGMDKGEFLKTFRADIFFDDQKGHCESTRKHVPTGHVPSGVANNPQE